MRLWTRARIGIRNLEDGGRKTCEFEVILGDIVLGQPVLQSEPIYKNKTKTSEAGEERKAELGCRWQQG